MFKDRTYLIIALAVLVLVASALFNWRRSVPYIDRSVPCQWDPSGLDAKSDTCEKQCAFSLYGGGTKNQGVINGKLMNFCCSKGYTPEVVENPITHVMDVVCRKD